MSVEASNNCPQFQLLPWEEFQIHMTIVEGEPWFCLRDICRILKVKNAAAVSYRAEPHEKRRISCPEGKRGPKTKLFVSQSGLHKILRVDKRAISKPLDDWLTREVLPAIHRDGCYTAGSTAPENQPALPGAPTLTVAENCPEGKAAVDSLRQEILSVVQKAEEVSIRGACISKQVHYRMASNPTLALQLTALDAMAGAIRSTLTQLLGELE